MQNKNRVFNCLRWIISTSILAAMTAAGGPAHGGGLQDEIVQEVIISEGTGGIINVPLSFDQFDDRGGQLRLESVTLTVVSGVISYLGEVENNDFFPFEVSFNASGSVFASAGPLDASSLISESTDSVFLDPSDGNPGSGPDFASFSLNVLPTFSPETEQDELDGFVGQGTVTGSFQVFTKVSIVAPGDATLNASVASSSYRVRLTYTYRDAVVQFAKETHTAAFDVSVGSNPLDTFTIPAFDPSIGDRTLTAASLALQREALAAQVRVENMSAMSTSFDVSHQAVTTVMIGPLMTDSSTVTMLQTGELSPPIGAPGAGSDFINLGDVVSAGVAGVTTFDGGDLAMFEGGDLTLTLDGASQVIVIGPGSATLQVDDERVAGEATVTYFFVDPSILLESFTGDVLSAFAGAQATGDLGGAVDGQGEALDDLVLLLDDPAPDTQGLLDIRINPGPNTDGTVGNLATSQVLAVGNDPSDVALGDFNDDGALDIAVANRGAVDNSIWTFINDNDGSGGFSTPPVIIVLPTGDGVEGLAVLDLNEDGLDDIALAAGQADMVRLFLNTAGNPGTFTQSAAVATGLLPTEVCPIDDDNDKDLDVDLAVLVEGDQQVILIDYDTKAAMGSVIGTPVDVGPGADALVTADFDENGAGDVLVTNSGNDTMSILLANVSNAGVGVLEPALLAPVDGTPRSPVAEDLDGDGDPDVAIVSNTGSDGPAAQVFENAFGEDGPGIFVLRPPIVTTLENEPQLLTAGELNGDALRDLIVIERATGGSALFGPWANDEIRLLLNNLPCVGNVAPDNGDGTFGDDDVDIDDLLAVISAFGPCADPDVCPEDIAPFGGNDVINIDDLLAVISNFGPCE